MLPRPDASPAHAGPTGPTAAQAGTRIPMGKLPFVGVRRDGQLGYWVLPPQPDGADLRLAGRVYAAWFLVYAEAHGARDARRLLDLIEREMPSRYPALDRAFLEEVGRQGFGLNAA